MRPLVTSQEMRELDLKTIQKLNMSSFELMDRVSEEIAAKLNLTKSYLFLCGPGNNGGDAYRIAERLRKRGGKVTALQVFAPTSIDCISAFKLYRGEFCEIESVRGLYDCIVDGIFGNGGREHLTPALKNLLKKVNEFQSLRLSIDVPTGVNSVSGKCHPHSFRADQTWSIGFPREIYRHEEVAALLGDLTHVGDYFASPKNPRGFLLEENDFSLPTRPRTAFKSQFGHCGVIGGSVTTPGAALLAAEAAHRVGAGYVSLLFARKSKELKIKLETSSFLYRVKWNEADLKPLSALVFGCGGVPIKFRPYRSFRFPIVVDADGLQGWGSRKKIQPKSRCILTPHPGEAAKILRVETREIQRDRLKSLKELQDRCSQAVYLKGAPGILAFEKHSYYVNLSINPVFAKAGSGDVLSGILGGILAQQPNEFEKSVISSLVFQRAVGEILRASRASLASDQLKMFSQAFILLTH